MAYAYACSKRNHAPKASPNRHTHTCAHAVFERLDLIEAAPPRLEKEKAKAREKESLSGRTIPEL
eukprot:scaffold11342_cov114-Isochrysis_galbana.AAC.6